MKKSTIALIILLSTQLHSKDIHCHEDKWVTIFVHGTLRPFLSISDFFKVLNDSVENSVYEHATRGIRNNPFFYQAQPMQQLGLRKIRMNELHSGDGAQIYAQVFDQIQSLIDPCHTMDAYYTFGWSALLSFSARRVAAEHFFHELNARFANYHKLGYFPKLRIIGFSHGGTTSLYLAEIAKRTGHQALFEVDELILIGTPIQSDTDYLINDPLFKKVYNIYSTGDLVQPSDVLSAGFDNGGRHRFENRQDFCIPAKLTEIRVKLLRHTLELTDQWGNKRIIKRLDHINPGHTELWYFSWSAEWYRKHFPLTPFPVAVFIPYLTSVTNKLGLNGHVEMTIDVELDKTRVTAINKDITVPFIKRSDYQQLQKFALDHAASSYKLDYKKQIHKTRKAAKELYRRNLPPVLTFGEKQFKRCPGKPPKLVTEAAAKALVNR